jgi:hypothetical protein
MKTAIATINRATINSDFFEVINRFKNEPAAKQDGQEENDRIHIVLFYPYRQTKYHQYF